MESKLHLLVHFICNLKWYHWTIGIETLVILIGVWFFVNIGKGIVLWR